MHPGAGTRPVGDPGTKRPEQPPGGRPAHDISVEDINHRFAFHRAGTPEKEAAHGTVRQITGDAARQLQALLPPGREKALAITALEEAMMWGNAALARSTNAAADAGNREMRERGGTPPPATA